MKKAYPLIALTLIVAFFHIGCNSNLTKENYDRVKPGMTTGEVLKILGSPDDKIEYSDATGRQVESWSYSSGGKTIGIAFLNGKVSSNGKSCSGF